MPASAQPSCGLMIMSFAFVIDGGLVAPRGAAAHTATEATGPTCFTEQGIAIGPRIRSLRGRIRGPLEATAGLQKWVFARARARPCRRS